MGYGKRWIIPGTRENIDCETLPVSRALLQMVDNRNDYTFTFHRDAVNLSIHSYVSVYIHISTLIH